MSGWRVDFNLSLQSFESNVKGVRNLVDLALSSPLPSPPRLLFTSSIAVLRREFRFWGVAALLKTHGRIQGHRSGP